MPTIWLTCLWDDNKDGDVDFVAQELIRAGVTVKLHRWNPRAKRSLWDQIKEFISDPEMADAWAVFATRTGLGSELCQRQLAGAFRHVVSVRGDAFPVIALFPSPVVPDLIPGDISMRLNVTLTDPDWKERLGLAASMEVQEVMPYALHVHEGVGPVGYRYAIEVRPRAGTWAPFIAAIPIAERTKVIPDLRLGPEGQVPDVSVVNWSSEGAEYRRSLVVDGCEKPGVSDPELLRYMPGAAK